MNRRVKRAFACTLVTLVATVTTIVGVAAPGGAAPTRYSDQYDLEVECEDFTSQAVFNPGRGATVFPEDHRTLVGRHVEATETITLSQGQHTVTASDDFEEDIAGGVRRGMRIEACEFTLSFAGSGILTQEEFDHLVQDHGIDMTGFVVGEPYEFLATAEGTVLAQVVGKR